ncbi:MAG: hypothetical protein HY794_17905 [Desulfarculus sp.]|nr:hypothetical protein [Desulfarculus sp.]
MSNSALTADIYTSFSCSLIAQFPDVPEALTEADTLPDVLYWAQDALIVALTGYLDDRRDIPQPSKPKRGQHLVALKLAIYQAMRDQGLSQSECHFEA